MAPANLVGIAIKATSQQHQSMHVGLIYERTSGGLYFVHLTGHNELEDEPAPNDLGYLWSDFAWLSDPENNSLADIIANHIEMCARTREIPYGPNPPDQAFDFEGRYICKNRYLGLTCATFVSHVLADIGIKVVDLSTWESRPDDQDWWEFVSRYIDEARTQELEGVRVNYRLRPDEVATAVAGEKIPLVFNEAIIGSASLRSQLFPKIEIDASRPDGAAVANNNIITAPLSEDSQMKTK
ncbi:hypothetical protein LRS73_18090 [Methylobacterium currus]|uniref:hypothetical protein n=1 Tax=Methylobacterium currus TaxID=2051553 RepID=UPI001E4A8544|nr:hypothetical protein [Methylobacterium currus]UHC14459.1 hypothetical protein LRS73_18090 [Methylobacterium currus]